MTNWPGLQRRRCRRSCRLAHSRRALHRRAGGSDASGRRSGLRRRLEHATKRIELAVSAGHEAVVGRRLPGRRIPTTRCRSCAGAAWARRSGDLLGPARGRCGGRRLGVGVVPSPDRHGRPQPAGGGSIRGDERSAALRHADRQTEPDAAAGEHTDRGPTCDLPGQWRAGLHPLRQAWPEVRARRRRRVWGRVRSH